jgi:membrane-associated phospholipid phosphatase
MYGMPSGHSSSVAFSTAYMFFALHSKKISSLYLFITIVTAIQRVIYNFHYLDQVFIGFIVGTVIAAAAYYLTRILMK